MNEDFIYNQLAALRYQALAVATTVEAVLRSMESKPATPDVAPPPPAATPTTSEGPCQHPEQFRIPTPAMGHRNRFKCMNCQADVDPDQEG